MKLMRLARLARGKEFWSSKIILNMYRVDTYKISNKGYYGVTVYDGETGELEYGEEQKTHIKK